MVKIAFFLRHVAERGTEVAIYDYAHYNETILGNQSIMIRVDGTPCKPDVLRKFESRFPLFTVREFGEIDDLLRRENVDTTTL